jgi:hypothetical protein
MSKRFECIRKTQQLPNGPVIDGHAYKPVVGINDIDTGRTYSVMQCVRCDKLSVGFYEGYEPVTDSIGPIVNVGGA